MTGEPSSVARQWMAPRAWWFLVPSDPGIRRCKRKQGWKLKCPDNPAHDLLVSFAKYLAPEITDHRPLVLGCFGPPDPCEFEWVLHSLGIRRRDLYPQPADDHAVNCSSRACRAPAYFAAGQTLCLMHLLDYFNVRRDVLFAP